MKVKKYIIEIYESPLDYTHEFKIPIVAYLKDKKTILTGQKELLLNLSRN
jgi:hypothetical protein